MSSFNWENFGEEIAEIVEKAVKNQNFTKLNQNISRTLNRAAVEEQTVKLPSKAGAILGMAAGYPLGMISLLVFLGCVTMFSALESGGIIKALSGIASVFSGGLVILGTGLAVHGTKKTSKIKQLKNYLQIIGKREYCNISELADKSGKSVSAVVKDLEYMMKKRWFTQAHFDQQKTCIMLTDKMYQQYCQLEKQKALMQEEAQRKEEERKVRQQQEAEKQRESQGISPEVQKVIAQGEAYIRKIRICNDEIPGEVISAKIDRIELLVNKIFERVKEEPKCVTDIRKLLEYYLPTTVKLLEAYVQMDAQPAGGENIQSAKREIEAALDTLNVAFEKLLDGLFQNTAWDVSSDISVLNTMLAQEGLTEDGLKNKVN